MIEWLRLYCSHGISLQASRFNFSQHEEEIWPGGSLKYIFPIKSGRLNSHVVKDKGSVGNEIQMLFRKVNFLVKSISFRFCYPLSPKRK
jgi:hypothetical protein